MVAEPGKAFIYGPSALQVFHQVLKEKLRGQDADRVSRAARAASDEPRAAALSCRSGGQSVACGRICPHRAAMGKDRTARARQRRASRQAGNARAMLARLAGQPRLFVRLVEQSRRARRTRVRFRSDARLRNGRARIGRMPVSAAMRRATSSPASAPVINGFTLFHRSTLIVVRHGGGGRFSDARFLRLLLGK